MKTTRLTLAGVLSAIFLFTACQRTAHKELNPNQPVAVEKTIEVPDNTIVGKKGGSQGPCNPNAYTIQLESTTPVNGNYEWIWSVQNPNPGNGNNGTSQDLSHWGMQFGTCFQWSSVVSAAYSNDGSNWTSFSPSYQVDPSQGCMTTPVLKFDYGTNGSNKTYYKLVVSANYTAGSTQGYYKSGGNTGCCTFQFTGIGCTIPTDPAGER